MENSKLKRINELAAIAKERELTAEEFEERYVNQLAAIAKERELTKEEFEERAQLRKEYIEEFRAGARQILDNTYVQTPDGKKHKLQKKGR